MGNEYLQVMDDVERSNCCVMLWCSTCGCDKFRSAVKGISDLQSALESLDLHQLTSHKDWYSMLRITVMDHRRSINWANILRAWLPYTQQNLRFADVVLYHIAAGLSREHETRKEWFAACLELAIGSKYAPLLESLVRILGPKAASYQNLVETALELAPGNDLLRDALSKAGFTPSNEDIRREKKRKIDGQKLFGAIHRGDVNAVCALMEKRADLELRDPEGRSPLEYAKFLERDDIVALIESTNVGNK